MFQLIKLMLISFGLLLFLAGCGGEAVDFNDLAEEVVEAPEEEVPEEVVEVPEVEVPPEPLEIINLAIGKAASQSSEFNLGAPADRAIDGNTDGVWRNNSVTHTVEEFQPWWQVDLGSVENISKINVFNRTDCCTDRLSNFYVLVSDTPFESTDLNESTSQAGVSSFYHIPEVDGSISFESEISGRYVRVQLLGSNNVLSLAEVEVLSSANPSPTPEAPDAAPTPVGTPEDIAAGASIFEQQCSVCHGDDAVQFFPLLDKYTDLESITEHTENTMPPTGPSNCVGDCASQVAAYILTLESEGGELTAEEIGTQRLKRSHYYKTIEFLLGEYTNSIDSLSHPEDPIVDGFEAGSEVNSTLVFAYHLNAGVLAKDFIETIESDGSIIGCNNLGADCVRQFYLDFAEQAYRFPLEGSQVQLLDSVFEGSGNNPLVGLGNVVAYVLQSPFFLYYLDSDDAATDYTLANNLSFTLWNEPPDAELLTLAAQGELRSPAEFNNQVDRLLNDDKAQQTMLDFANQWLGLDRVRQVFKDEVAVPGFSADVVVELEQDLFAFVETSLQQENSFEYLFNGGYQLSNSLASTLGQWSDNVRASRNGVLSQPGILATLSGPAKRSPILRGAYVMDKLLCDHREPAAGIDDVVSNIAVPEDANPREVTELLTESAVCQVCHATINPLGFGFEDFDGLGLPIGDSFLETIEISATDRADSVFVSFNGIEDMQQNMLQTQQFYDCAADQALSYANLIDRPSTASADQIYEEFRDSANIKSLLKAIVSTMIETNR